MSGINVLPYPRRLVIELTPKCNLACPMCPRHYVDERDGFMDSGLWKRLVDEVVSCDPETIVLPFWRGESLLHPDFAPLMKYALDRSVRIHISTNGHRLTDEHSRILLRCEFVTFSIHTALGYANAKDFLSLKKGGRPTTQVSFVQGEKTAYEILPQMLSSPSLAGFDSMRLYEEHTKGGVFGHSGSSANSVRLFCPKLTDTLIVSYNGTASRCNHVWKTEPEIDLKAMSIKSAWESQRLVHIRESYPDALCALCDQWTGHTCGEAWRIVEGEVEHKVHGYCGVVNN